MPTTTWATMRQDILRPLGLITGSTTTNISSGNANVLDTKLTDRFPVDDYFNNRFFVHITSGNNAGTVRRVTDYAQSSGTLTAAGANWSAESGSVTFELSNLHPDDVTKAYDQARQIVFPNISIIRDLESIVTGLDQYTYTVPSSIRLIDRVYRGNRRNADSNDNLLLNGDFEDWSSTTACDNWSVTGGGASMNQEAQTNNPENYAVLHGDNSLRLVVPDSTAVTLVQTFDSTSSNYTAVATQGVEANLGAWVYSTTASRISLTIDGAVQSETHGGTGWEWMKGSQTTTQNDTEFQVGLSISSGGAIAVYVDEVWLSLGQSEITEIPYLELRNWDHVPPVAGASNGGVIRFQETLPDKYRIRIVGRDILTAAASDSTTIEIDGDLLHPVYDKVRQLLCLRMAAGDPDSNWTEMARQYEASYVRAVEGALVGVNAPPVAIPRMVF